jgi:hypothetical protein
MNVFKIKTISIYQRLFAIKVKFILKSHFVKLFKILFDLKTMDFITLDAKNCIITALIGLTTYYLVKF